LIWLVLTAFVLLGYSLQSVVGIVYYTMVMKAYGTVTSPPIILEEGNCSGTSTIYTNNTSALITVEAPINDSAAFNYVLKIVNKVTNIWTVNLQVYDNSSLSRMSSLNISLHNGASSNQIAVSGGNIVKSEGPPYNLAGNATIYIALSNLHATATGISYLYVHLKIQVPNTSTYILYVIIFKIS
jgi:hypothetical protein